MSTQSDHGHELIPRPEHAPDALRAALAAVEPGRLEEMQAQKDEAFAKAVEWQSLSPVQSAGCTTGTECRPGRGHEGGPRVSWKGVVRNERVYAVQITYLG
ncbi:hypothetical protein [Streptomyces sp. NPDC047042]|uniref:hypothetical protein n=1 Tax=Streptomyces sp. NPDC047042 TaxID=3154807 RepID=UPI0033FC4426